MKIAITGHTKGIGLGLKQYYERNYTVVGFSRTNGYNIKDYKRIVQESLDCDIFINNAYCENYQTLLLEELYNYWQDQEKIIVNIGTFQTEYHWGDHYTVFQTNKFLLKNKFKQLANVHNQKIKLVLISPGATDTPMIEEVEKNNPNIRYKKMNPNKLAEIIDYAIQTEYVKEITAYIL
jgi:short-subunit dehydrogenase